MATSTGRAINVNWDAVVNKKKGYIGIGIITRDCYDFFLGARSFSQKVSGGSKMGEGNCSP
jgi:hypothetical protein